VDDKTERVEESLTGVDIVLDTVVGVMQQRALRVLKRGGILVSVVSPVPAGQSIACSRDARRCAASAWEDCAEHGVSFEPGPCRHIV
jgi:NADPH:quinone reductase-like Zn-dependent oxidoreductase